MGFGSKAWISVRVVGVSLIVILAGCTVPAPSPLRITAEPENGYAPLLVTFEGRYTGTKFYDPTPDPEPEPPEEPVPAAWSWQFGDGSTAEGQRVTHEYEEPGSFTVRLTVTMSDDSTKSCTSAVEVWAYEPIADAGPDRTILIGQEAWLDGSGSSDPGGNDLVYAWSLVERPSGSTCTLGHSEAAACSIVPDVPGMYRVRLVVNNGYSDSEPDEATITAQATPAEQPIADAGPDQTIDVGEQVWLDGSGSSDPLHYPLTYRWSWVSRPEGSGAQLEQATTQLGTFIADIMGEYRVALVVSNGTLDSEPDEAVVTAVAEENHAPVADAGPDQAALVGDEVWLDGSASSDPDGDALTFSWSWATGPNLQTGTLTSTSAVQPSFTPHTAGTYRLQLVVSDGDLDSVPDEVTVEVTEEEHLPPIANAGADRVITLAEDQDEVSVSLDGSASYARQGTLVAYTWSGSPDPADVVRPELTLGPGNYSFALVVKDSLDQESAPDSVSIVVRRPAEPAFAIAEAGDDIDVTLAPDATTTVVTLDGSGSYVTAGSIASYAWTGDPDPDDVVRPSLTLGTGVYTFTLVVTGTGGEVSDPDRVTVRVRSAGNQPPAFTSAPLAEAVQHRYYYYDADAEDPEGGAVRYALGTAPTGMRIDEATGFISWTPTARQLDSLPVEIFAYDPENLEANQAYTITIARTNLPPAIVSAPLRNARAGETYTYTIVALDEDGDAIEYGLVEGQDGMAVDGASGLLTWTPTAAHVGRHWQTVSATDSMGAVDTQEFMVEVVDPDAPVTIESPSGDYTVLVGDTLQLALDATPEVALFSVDPMPPNAYIDHEKGRFVFKPTASQQGWHPVVFSARLGDQWASSPARIHVIREENHAPTIDAIPAQTVREGEQLTVPIAASDPDGDSILLTLQGAAPANSVLDGLNTEFLFAPDYTQAGSYNVTVKASDGSADTTAAFTIVVENVVEEAGIDVVIDPPASPTFQVSQTIRGTVDGEAQPQQPAPLVFITGLAPDAIRQAETKTISVTGYNTEFVTGATTFDFGADIHVDSVTVNSPTEALVTVTASTIATLGVRTVTVDHDGPDAYSVVGFTVREGAAVVSGTVIDPFTQQPLAGARITVMATGQYVVADSEGEFRIEGVPSGEVELLVTMPNYRATRFNVAVETNANIALDTPVSLDALVRPFNPGGSMERAATVPSVIDRGFCALPDDATIEQLVAIVSDAYLAVGGTEVGVLDEAGNQLNPNIADSTLAYINFTPAGLRMQADAAQQRPTKRLGEVVRLFLDAFESEWAEQESVGHMIQMLQDAATFAWANPSHPNSGVVLLIFNKSNSLSIDPPLLNESTLLNPLQVSMLTNALLVANAYTLEASIDEVLIEQGIDPDAAAAEAFAMLRQGQTWDASYAWPGYSRPSAAKQSAGTTIALPPNQMTDYDRYGLRGLTGGNQFSKFAQTVLKESVLKIAKDTLWSTIIGMVVKGVFAYSMGSTGGLTGQTISMTIYVAFEEAVISTLIEKVLISGMLASIQDQLTPMPVVPVSSRYSEDGGFLLLAFPKSTSHGQTLDISLPTGWLDQDDTTGAWVTAHLPMFKWTYELYLFDDLYQTDILKAVPLLDAQLCRHENPDYLTFKIPVQSLRSGVNFLRIATVQYRDQVVYEKQREIELEANRQYLEKTYSHTCPSYVKDFLGSYFADDTYCGTIDNILKYPADKRFLKDGEAQLWVQAETKRIFGTTTADLSGEAAEVTKLEGLTQQQQSLLQQQLELDLDFVSRKSAIETQTVNIGAMTESYARHNKPLDAAFWQKVEDLSGIPAGNDLRKQVQGLYADHRFAIDSSAVVGQYKETGTTLARLQGGLQGVQGKLTPGTADKVLTDFRPGGKYSHIAEIGENVGGTNYKLTVNYLDENALPKQYTAVLDLNGGPPTEIVDLRTTNGTNFGNAVTKAKTVDIDLSEANFVKYQIGQVDFQGFTNQRNTLRQQIGAVDGEITKQQKVVSDLLSKKNRLSNLTNKFNPKAKIFKAIGTAMDFVSAGLLAGQTLEQFFQGIAVLRSDLSAPHQIVYYPESNYPPYITPYPDYELFNAFVTTAPEIDPHTGEENPRGGLLRVYSIDNTILFEKSAGFPAEFLTIDSNGWLYAVNGASVDSYGGRIFRYDSQNNFARELAGSIHFYNTVLQYGHPARPISSVVAMAGANDGGAVVPKEHLFLPDVEFMTSMHQALPNPTPRIANIPIYKLAQPEYNGPTGGQLRSELVSWESRLPIGIPWEFRFTGPTDIVAAPAGVVQDFYVSDLGRVYRLRLDLESSTTNFERADLLVDMDGAHEWSGLTMDVAGTLYIADYADGHIYFLRGSEISHWDASGATEPLVPRSMNPRAQFNRPGDIEMSHDQRQLIVSTADGPQTTYVSHILKFGESVSLVQVVRGDRIDRLHNIGNAGEPEFRIPVDASNAMNNRERLLVDYQDSWLGVSRTSTIEMTIAPFGMQEIVVDDIGALAGNP